MKLDPADGSRSARRHGYHHTSPMMWSSSMNTFFRQTFKIRGWCRWADQSGQNQVHLLSSVFFLAIIHPPPPSWRNTVLERSGLRVVQEVTCCCSSDAVQKEYQLKRMMFGPAQNPVWPDHSRGSGVLVSGSRQTRPSWRTDQETLSQQTRGSSAP